MRHCGARCRQTTRPITAAKLTGNRVFVVDPLLNVGAEHAVMRASFRLADGPQETDVLYPECLSPVEFIDYLLVDSKAQAE